MSRFQKHICFILIVLAITHCNSLFGDFVYDDGIVIVNNNFIKSFSNIGLLFDRRYLADPVELLPDVQENNVSSGEYSWRPAATLSYMMNYALAKMHPWGFRLVNLLLHGANTILVYLLGVVLFGNPILSLFSALLFGAHPVQAEVINCTAFRANSLAFFFCLLSLLMYLKSASYELRKRGFILAVSLGFFVLGLLSKEIACLLPFALIVCDYFVYNFDARRLFGRWRLYVTYFLALGIYLWLYFSIFTPTQSVIRLVGTQDLFLRVLRTFDILALYLKDAVLPCETVFLPAVPLTRSYARIFIGIGIVAMSGLVIFKGRPKAVAFGMLWFFLWLWPMNNFFNDFRILMAYRYLYFAMAGFALAGGYLCARIWDGGINFAIKSNSLRKATVVAYLVYICLAAIIANSYWKNDLRRCIFSVGKYPLSGYAHTSLGLILMKQGNKQEAIRELNLAVTQCKYYSAPRDLANAYFYLGDYYRSQGNYAAACEMFGQALRLFPLNLSLHISMGASLGEQGKYELALKEFKLAKAIKPDSFIAYEHSGVTYKLMHDWLMAKREFTRALELNPNIQRVRDELASLEKLMESK